MQRMLEAYLAFARGDMGEQSAPTDMADFLQELKDDAERTGHKASVDISRPADRHREIGGVQALPRQSRHQCRALCARDRDHRAPRPSLADRHHRRRRTGHSAAQREEVFKPFLRLDDARNQDEGGTGLGLAIARDIARSHGGDIMLGDSPLGGLRATVRVPV